MSKYNTGTNFGSLLGAAGAMTLNIIPAKQDDANQREIIRGFSHDVVHTDDTVTQDDILESDKYKLDNMSVEPYDFIDVYKSKMHQSYIRRVLTLRELELIRDMMSSSFTQYMNGASVLSKINEALKPREDVTVEDINE